MRLMTTRGYELSHVARALKKAIRRRDAGVAGDAAWSVYQ